MSRTPDDARRLRRRAAALLAGLLAGGAVAAGARPEGPGGGRADASELVRALELSGLALGSGAAYARHPAQADGFAPFGEHPGALEHQPSGSLLLPGGRRGEGEERRPRNAAEAAP